MTLFYLSVTEQYVYHCAALCFMCVLCLLLLWLLLLLHLHSVLLLLLLVRRLCFPDDHCLSHQHVGMLLLGLLDGHGESLIVTGR